ncbi:MAG: hypothetical protein K5656_06030 [Lachnospiraceae bacterium]|nr:hypothetical protein [Lachnospiraceae bacterium]
MSKAYYLGLFAGILFALVFTILAVYLFKKNNKNGGYDERQAIARGKAYSAGFYTMLIELFFAAFLSDIGVELFSSADALFLLAVIGLLVFVVICIINDAYARLNENPKKVIILLASLGLLNLALSLTNSDYNRFGVIKGKLYLGSPNIIIAVALILIAIIFGIKQLTSNDEE